MEDISKSNNIFSDNLLKHLQKKDVNSKFPSVLRPEMMHIFGCNFTNEKDGCIKVKHHGNSLEQILTNIHEGGFNNILETPFVKSLMDKRNNNSKKKQENVLNNNLEGGSHQTLGEIFAELCDDNTSQEQSDDFNLNCPGDVYSDVFSLKLG